VNSDMRDCLRQRYGWRPWTGATLRLFQFYDVFDFIHEVFRVSEDFWHVGYNVWIQDKVKTGG